jgi:hypothetical protein
MSADYGSTWSMYTSAATGIPRQGAAPVSISRTFYIMSGYSDTTKHRLNDVWQGYW